VAFDTTSDALQVEKKLPNDQPPVSLAPSGETQFIPAAPSAVRAFAEDFGYVLAFPVAALSDVFRKGSRRAEMVEQTDSVRAYSWASKRILRRKK
jgi:hypothetical protein